MLHLMNTICHRTQGIRRHGEHGIKQFAQQHPYVYWACMFAGAPIILVAAVFLLTSVDMLPLSWMIGWL